MFASTELPTSLFLLCLIAIPFLVAINGFFVAAEFAIVAIRRTRVEELVKQNVPSSQALLTAVDRMDDSVAASQLGITLASLALGFGSEKAIHQLLSPLFKSLPASWEGPIATAVSLMITLCLITYMHVVFGEQMPKIAALQSAERIGLWVAKPINFFARVSRPIVKLMNNSSMLFLRWMGYKPSSHDGEVHTVDELRLLIEDTEEAGLIDAEQADFVMNVFSLADKNVADCMIPKEKMTALNVRAKRDEILQVVRDSGHTRLPVWEDREDNIIGIVNTKEIVFLFMTVNPLVVLDDMLYSPTFLKPDVKISDALRTFKKTHKPMGIVRDGEGKILGLITLEDVIEEIIGDIEDEHDVKLSKISRLPKRRKR